MFDLDKIRGMAPDMGTYRVRDDNGNVLITTSDFVKAYTLACSTVEGRLFKWTKDGWQGYFIFPEDRQA